MEGSGGRAAHRPGDASMDSQSENFAQKSFRSVGRSRDEVGVGATLPAAFNRTLFDDEIVASWSDGSVNGTETNVSSRAASARNVLARALTLY